MIHHPLWGSPMTMETPICKLQLSPGLGNAGFSGSLPRYRRHTLEVGSASLDWWEKSPRNHVFLTRFCHVLPLKLWVGPVHFPLHQASESPNEIELLILDKYHQILGNMYCYV